MNVSDSNQSAEMAVIAAVMVDPSVLPEVVDLLVPDDFYTEANRIVWQAILDLDLAGSSPDLVTVTNALSETGQLKKVGGASALAASVDTLPDVSHARHYATIVRDMSASRSLAVAVNRAMHANRVSDAMEIIQSAVDRISEGDGARTTSTLAEVAGEVAARARSLAEGRSSIRGFKTGFAGIDRLLTTLHPGRLILLAARPSLGKTTLACNIVMNVAAKGGNVLFASLEMSRKELAEKMIAAESGVDTRSFQSGRFNMEGAPNDVELIEDMAKVFIDRNVFIDDRSAMTASQLRALIRKTKAAHGLDLVVVDYLQLMQGQGKNNNDIYGEISRAMKCMAKDLDVPILALSQLSRSPESEGRLHRPRLSDLRDSGRLEQDADVVMFIVRDKDDAPRIAQVQVAKHRQGPVGDAPLRFDPNASLFTDGEWSDFVED